MKLNQELLNKEVKKYHNLKITGISSSVCMITSRFDEWYISVEKSKRFNKSFVLYHRNTHGDINDYHIQHDFFIREGVEEEIIYSIYDHDNFVRKQKKKNQKKNKRGKKQWR